MVDVATAECASSSSIMDKKYVRTSYGDIAYLEAGNPAAPPVLFVHGIPTSSFLWRHVLRFLQNDLHCIAPDLMGLGDTRVAPEGPFDMEAQANMLLEVMSALGHTHFGLVCHDQGGAAAQLIAARFPQRVDAFVVTDCVCYDNWPVPAIARLQRLAQVPFVGDALGRLGIFDFLETRTPLSNFRRGVHDPTRLTDEVIREYLRPIRGSEDERRRFLGFLLAGHPRYTEIAVDGLRRFDKPTLVLWAADDRYLSPSWGRRLAEDIPGTERFELVPFCGHFWQEERPAEFASHMGAFLVEHLKRAAAQRAAAPPPAPAEQVQLD